ncbi:hypothetical protein DRO55_06625 [Candidatus Bathyarchaeota archaeon]|nr:MAG: hypothetical protein DRO55_06625 [Candidatus Bathyarchaeota archaeon]
MEDLLGLAERAVEAAIKEGADQADSFSQRRRTVWVEIERNSIKSCGVTVDHGISVRAFIDGGMGFAYTQRLDPESAKRTAARAARLAGKAQPDPDFKSLVEPKKAGRVPNLYDREVAEMSIESVVDMAAASLEAAESVSKDIIINGGISASLNIYALSNSLGVAVEEEKTALNIGVMAVVRRGSDVGSYYEWDVGRSLRDVKPEDVGVIAVERSMRYLGSRKVKTGTLPVVFGFTPAHSLMASTIAGAANAENIQRERSYLIGKLGEKIASSNLTIVDDGTIPGGVASSTYDGEGSPKRRLTVVEDGVLRMYLHNSYTANKAGVETTASAVRGSYRSTVGIGTSNIRISPGDWSLNEMIEETREGIYFELGWISGNPVTGDISKPIDFGFKIEDGELAYPVKNALIGSKVLHILGNIDAISKDYREEPGLIMPAIRVREVRIAGAR